jgi:hypothetical protein
LPPSRFFSSDSVVQAQALNLAGLAAMLADGHTDLTRLVGVIT